MELSYSKSQDIFLEHYLKICKYNNVSLCTSRRTCGNDEVLQYLAKLGDEEMIDNTQSGFEFEVHTQRITTQIIELAVRHFIQRY